MATSGRSRARVRFAHPLMRLANRATCTCMRRRCEDCDLGRMIVEMLPLYLAVTACVLALVGGVHAFRRWAPQATRERWERWWRVMSIVPKLKQLYGFFVIISKVEGVYQLRLPGRVSQQLAVINAMCSFGLDAVLDTAFARCFGLGSHYVALEVGGVEPASNNARTSTQSVRVAPLTSLHAACVCVCVLRACCMQVAMLLPAVLIGVAVSCKLGYLWRQGRLWAESMVATAQRCLGPSIVILFIMYPPVTKTAFESFACHNFTAVPATAEADGNCQSQSRIPAVHSRAPCPS